MLVNDGFDFLIEAMQQNLNGLYGDIERESRGFIFYLRQDEIYLVNPTPERVIELLHLALKHARRPGSGEYHAILLTFVSEVANIDSHIAHWISPNHVRLTPRFSDKKWISLKQWLEQQGMNLQGLVSD